MITFYTKTGCEYCNEIEEMLMERGYKYKAISVKDSKDKQGKDIQYGIDEDDNKVDFKGAQIKFFPFMYVGDTSFSGRESILDFLNKGYIDEIGNIYCSKIGKNCIQTECVEHMILLRGKKRIPIGDCCKKWKIKLELETRKILVKELGDIKEKLDLLNKNVFIGGEMTKNQIKEGLENIRKQHLMINMIKGQGPVNNNKIEEKTNDKS